jgi:hypothetical protein
VHFFSVQNSTALHSRCSKCWATVTTAFPVISMGLGCAGFAYIFFRFKAKKITYFSLSFALSEYERRTLYETLMATCVSLVADFCFSNFFGCSRCRDQIWKLFPLALDKPPTRSPSLLLYMPEVTKRCRLSLLTNSALVFESQLRGDREGGCGVSVQLCTSREMEPK